MNYFEVLKIEYWLPAEEILRDLETKLTAYIAEGGTDNIELRKRHQNAAAMRQVFNEPARRNQECSQWKTELDKRASLEISLLKSSGISSVSRAVFQSMCGLQGSVGLSEHDMENKLKTAGITIQNAASAGGGPVAVPPPKGLGTDSLFNLLNTYQSAKKAGNVMDIFDFLSMDLQPSRPRKVYFDLITRTPEKLLETVSGKMNGMTGRAEDQVAAEIYSIIATMLEPNNGKQQLESYFNSIRYRRIESLKANVFKAKKLQRERQKLFTPAYRKAIISMIETMSGNQVESPEIGPFTHDQAVAICNDWIKGMSLPESSDTPSLITIQCSCGAVHDFPSAKDAYNAICAVCGNTLYIKCGNQTCNAPLPNSAFRCSKCGFNQREYLSITRSGGLLDIAKGCLAGNNLAEARTVITILENAEFQNKATKDLIKKYKNQFSEQLDCISVVTRLISQYKLEDAEQKITEYEKQYHEMKLVFLQEKQQIIDLRKEILQMRNTAAGLSGAPQNDAYARLYERFGDSDAEKWLKSHGAPPVSGVSVTCDEKTGYCTVSWNAQQICSLNRYHIVRKAGSPSLSPNDGDILTHSLKGSSHCDQTAEPGKAYYYSVFVLRGNTVSVPKTHNKPVYSFKIVSASSVQVTAMDRCVKLSWDMPAGSEGVDLYRIQPDGVSVKLCNRSKENGFTDFGSPNRPLLNQVTYTYSIKTIYKVDEGLKAFDGGQITATPCPDIPDVSIVSAIENWGRDNLGMDKHTVTITLNQPAPKDICIAAVAKKKNLPKPGFFTANELRAASIDLSGGIKVNQGDMCTEAQWEESVLFVPVMNVDSDSYYLFMPSDVLKQKEPPRMRSNKENPDCLRPSAKNKKETDLFLMFSSIPQDASQLILVIKYSSTNAAAYVDEVPDDPSLCWEIIQVDLPKDKTDYKLERVIQKPLENGHYYLSAFVRYKDGKDSKPDKRPYSRIEKSSVKYHFIGNFSLFGNRKPKQVKITFYPAGSVKTLPGLTLLLAHHDVRNAGEARKSALFEYELPVKQINLSNNTFIYTFDSNLMNTLNQPIYKDARLFIVSDKDNCPAEEA